MSDMLIRVGVFGAAGKMGKTICDAVSNDPQLALTAIVDPAYAQLQPADIGEYAQNISVAADASQLDPESFDVAIDFTHLNASRENCLWLASHNKHVVVGTTGFSDEDMKTFEKAFINSNALFAPNFAIGAILLMKFAEMAAPYFETAEIIEFHHDQKKDSPSGTAMLTVERMAQASSEWADDPTEKELLQGSRGGEGPNGIRVHAVRMRGMVAHQEVLLGTTGQTLSIRHDSYDRTSFMPGVLLAAKKVSAIPGITIGLDTLL